MNRFTIAIAITAFLFALSVAHAGSEHVDNNGRGEPFWRQKADSLRRQLEDQQVQLDTVNKQEQHCRDQQITYYRGLPRDCAAMYRNQKIAIEDKITQIRKRLEVDLPEEARRAGAYPGWLR